MARYIAGKPELASRLGGAETRAEWSIKEARGSCWLSTPPPLQVQHSAILHLYFELKPRDTSPLPLVSVHLTLPQVGDGNINFVFIVQGPKGAIVLKQALPFVRIVGEGWPLDIDRIRVEALSLVEHRRWCPEHVPEVFSWDAERAVLAMRFVEPPHAILRLGLVQGKCAGPGAGPQRLARCPNCACRASQFAREEGEQRGAPGYCAEPWDVLSCACG